MSISSLYLYCTMCFIYNFSYVTNQNWFAGSVESRSYIGCMDGRLGKSIDGRIFRGVVDQLVDRCVAGQHVL